MGAGHNQYNMQFCVYSDWVVFFPARGFLHDHQVFLKGFNNSGNKKKQTESRQSILAVMALGCSGSMGCLAASSAVISGVGGVGSRCVW